jgi:hypothetical protein
MPSHTPHPSSYRDPSGYIFQQEGKLYRQVNQSFKEDFEQFMNGGCYERLVQKGLLIPHKTVTGNLTGDPDRYTTIQPETIPFISYPYEWSFDMLKDAALLTLEVLKEALASGMILKDASAYNIQWHKGKLIFIDSLSFEKYDETVPWIAYRQFCEHFLSPLLLSHYSKSSLQDLLLAYSDGIPLSTTSSLLPWKTRFSIHTYLHIHLHAKYGAKNPGKTEKQTIFSKKKLLNLVNSLELLIKKLKAPSNQTTWSGYYEEAAMRGDYLGHKQQIISTWLDRTKPPVVADLGANRGEFSRLAASKNCRVIASDFDAVCINELYRDIKRTGDTNILPLIIDLSHPSPAIGVNNNERASFTERSSVDMAFALALIHHLAIGKNIPFEKTASFLQQICRYLIIEFVPKNDEKVQLMLSRKKDIYNHYTVEAFENAFSKYFKIEAKEKINHSERVIYLLKKNEG